MGNENISSNKEIEEFLTDIYNFLKNIIQNNYYENDLNNKFKANELIYTQLFDRCEKIIKNYKYDLNHHHQSENLSIDSKFDNMKITKISPLSSSSAAVFMPKISRAENITVGDSQLVTNKTSDDNNVYLEMHSKKNDSAEYIVFNNFPTTNKINNDYHNDHDEVTKAVPNTTNPTVNNEIEKIYDNCDENYTNNNNNNNNEEHYHYPHYQHHDHENNVEKHQKSKKRQEKDNNKSVHKTIIKGNTNDISLICPYIGLPAAHLNIFKSRKYGQLYRIERRLFFDQIKKYYCGIISDWLLCYPEGTSLLRPTLYVHLKSTIDIEIHGSDDSFQIIDNDTSKKILFQAPSNKDAKEWIHAIKIVIGKEKDNTALPSLAEQVQRSLDDESLSKLKLLNNSNSNAEEIYEVPHAPEWYNYGIYECRHKLEYDKSPNEYATETICNNKLKLFNERKNNDCDVISNDGDRNVNDNDFHNNEGSEINEVYDTFSPFSLSSVAIQKSNNVTNDVIDMIVEKSTEPDESQQFKSKVPIKLASTNTVFQDKIKDIHLKLSNQLSPVGGNFKPEMKKLMGRKSSVFTSPLYLNYSSSINNEDESKKVSMCKNSQNVEVITSNTNAATITTTTTTTTTNINTVRNWFLSRLNRSSISSNKIIKSKENTSNSSDDVDDENEGDDECSYYDEEFRSANNCTHMEKIKGNRIHSIINQLEAKGRLPLIGKNLNRSHGIYDDRMSDNNSGYEPIMTLKTAF